MVLNFSVGTKGGTLTVQREPDDHKVRASSLTKDVHGWGAEIHLLFMLVRLLNGYGFNLASVKVAADGHLYGGDHMRYLRTSKKARRESVVPYRDRRR